MRRQAWSAVIGGMVGAALVMLVLVTVPAVRAQQEGAAKPSGQTAILEELGSQQADLLEKQEDLIKLLGEVRADTQAMRADITFLKRRSRKF